MSNLYKLKPQDQLEVDKTAGSFRVRPRHRSLVWAFIIVVLAPTALAAVYLFAFASDRYASHAGFSVRSEETVGQADLLQGLTSLSGGSKTDVAMVHRFLESPEIVATLSESMDLNDLLSPPAFDPAFMRSPNTFERLTNRWRRLITLSYDSRTGLVSTRVNAFSPEDATRVNEAMLNEAAMMLSRLSAKSREESTALAREELTAARDRLQAARIGMTEFRASTRTVDPASDLEGQLSVMASLQSQMVEAQIALNLLLESSNHNDPRLVTAQNRVAVIASLLEDERTKFGSDRGGFVSRSAEYESLLVELEYAQSQYLSARKALDLALVQAQKSSRYLAVHIQPTRPQTPDLSGRWNLLVLLTLGLIGIWAILTLGFYGARGQR